MTDSDIVDSVSLIPDKARVLREMQELRAALGSGQVQRSGFEAALRGGLPKLDVIISAPQEYAEFSVRGLWRI